MRGRNFGRLITVFLLSFNLVSNSLGMDYYEKSKASSPLIVCVIGENEEDNNKIASLVIANDIDVKLGDIEVTKFDPMQLYSAKNNPNLKVGVITYNPKI